MPTNLTKRQLIIIGGIGALVVVVVAAIFLNLRPKPNNAAAVKLTVWGTEDEKVVGSLMSAYPYATVKYVHVDQANYESQLLSALAAGAGPDVFEIGDHDLMKWRGVLAPLPTSSIQFSPLQLSQYFPDVVTQDFVLDGGIYGVPLSIDTLAMIYNKDLFNAAQIAVPPATWTQFDNNIASLRALNAQGQLTRAAAAIGGSRASVPNAADIISLLMLQNGTNMLNDNGTTASFASAVDGGKGPAAFNFYLQFANAASPYYTWSDGMGDALTNFIAGKTAIIFGYAADLATIKAKAPFLNIGVAAMPQADGATVAVNYPRYQGFVVAKASPQQAAAWGFILYLTVSSGDGKAYQAATGLPPALRTDIGAYRDDPVLSVYSSQILTAKSWREPDDAKVAAAFDAAIKNVLTGAEDPSRALSEAETAVSQMIK